MGKRKERRLAAHTNAGRRVKLDLFAEPSGDLGGSSSSVNEEAEGERDSKRHSGLPNSPTSSGQPTQNPLLLLGQYSDDDLDEESNRSPSHATAENSPSDHRDQVGSPGVEKEVGVGTVQDFAAEKVETQVKERDPSPVLQSVEGSDSGENDATAYAGQCDEADSTKQIAAAGASNAQVAGDANSEWRLVMHEESNQYYYWNTVTGETSWEVPDALARTTMAVSDQIVPTTEVLEIASADINDSSSTLGIKLDSSSAAISDHGPVGANLNPQSQDVHGNGPQVHELFDEYRSESAKDETYVIDSYPTESQNNLSTANDEVEKAMEVSSILTRQCESLLERLKSLEGYASRLQFHDRVSKYILEVDIRLSDIKALSSYGSPLLPFWNHCQTKLKQLEDTINSEIYQLAVSSQLDDDVEAKEKKNIGHDSDGCENNREFEVACVSRNFENASHNDPQENNVYAGNDALVTPNGHLGHGATVVEEVDGATHQDPEMQLGEDVDMDVDMEVEDGEIVTTSTDALSAVGFPPEKQLSQPNTPHEYPSLASIHESMAPPLPEEDWIPPPPPESDQIPPPPPDNELVPPLPPDEPPESSYPLLSCSSYSETGQVLPYTEQYNLSYPESGFQYYGLPGTVPTGDLYGHADGSQVGMPHSSIYYDVAHASQVMVSSVEPVAYYATYQDGSIPPMPVVKGVESSHLPNDSNLVTSDQMKVVEHPLEAAQNLKFDTVAVADETVKPSSPLTTETAATTNLKENNTVRLANAVSGMEAVSTKLTAAKVQSKVTRSKKRTVAVAPSMRSNKKVSSMVDKWKAAKEELNETEEDEPENAYEILERKRQREIEEWRAKQIASGEAKDNANFQPLGGDWRERVKRRRAQLAKESARIASEAAPTDEKQQPDLTQLSKGLPSNWQAYWDEASKQVYYGNVITSETTWIKPTK
ncbi:WW domain-containing protein [Euphorbia peplus]|nr:WW domain-containing protein [Euphorbia peplus]